MDSGIDSALANLTTGPNRMGVLLIPAKTLFKLRVRNMVSRLLQNGEGVSQDEKDELKAYLGNEDTKPAFDLRSVALLLGFLTSVGLTLGWTVGPVGRCGRRVPRLQPRLPHVSNQWGSKRSLVRFWAGTTPDVGGHHHRATHRPQPVDLLDMKSVLVRFLGAAARHIPQARSRGKISGIAQTCPVLGWLTDHQVVSVGCNYDIVHELIVDVGAEHRDVPRRKPGEGLIVGVTVPVLVPR